MKLSDKIQSLAFQLGADLLAAVRASTVEELTLLEVGRMKGLRVLDEPKRKRARPKGSKNKATGRKP